MIDPDNEMAHPLPVMTEDVLLRFWRGEGDEEPIGPLERMGKPRRRRSERVLNRERCRRYYAQNAERERERARLAYRRRNVTA